MTVLRSVQTNARAVGVGLMEKAAGKLKRLESVASVFHVTAALVTAGLFSSSARLNGAEAKVSSPIEGEVSGAFRWLDLPGSPELLTQVEAKFNAAGQLEFTVSAKGDGVVLAASVGLPQKSQDGWWKMTRGEIDLAVWEQFIAARFAAEAVPADLDAQGTVHVSGEGKWSAGGFSGLISADLNNGRAASATQSWSVTGLALHTVLELKGSSVELRNSRITAATVEVASLQGRDLAISLEGRAGGEWSMEEAKLATLGGSIVVEPLTFLPAKPELDLVIGLNDLDLSQLARLVPQALTRAGGHLSGRIGLRWTAEKGFTPKQGSLRLEANEGATLQLANTPGFLSGRVPSKINLLPSWTGPLAKMVAQESPAYVALREIESGKVPLKVEKLEIDLYPDGPEAPRSAQVNVTASPASGSSVKTVRFKVTVVGPLDEVLKLGLDNRVGLSVKSGL